MLLIEFHMRTEHPAMQLIANESIKKNGSSWNNL